MTFKHPYLLALIPVVLVLAVTAGSIARARLAAHVALVKLEPVPLYGPDGLPNAHNVVPDAFHRDKTINIPDADHYAGHDLSGTKKFDQFTAFHSVSFLTVPLKPLRR